MILNILSSAAVTAALLTGGSTTSAEKPEDPTMNIVEVASSTGSFNTLVAALKAAGLVETLSGEGPFPVFAPTDEAFAAVDPGALEALLADPQALVAVLTYHVVAGEYPATQVLAFSSLATVNGAQAPISLDEDGNPRIDDAVITATDIEARNRIVHVIDRGIFPN